MPKTKVVFSWSSGKDSALALYKILSGGEFEVVALFSTVSKDFDRVAMHGTRRELLLKQAENIGLPLQIIDLPTPCTNEVYENAMREAMLKFKNVGIETVAFGDIYLEDVRNYRIENLSKIGMKAVFPLWRTDTKELCEEIFRAKIRAVVTCVDTAQIDGSFAGREFNRDFIADLPENADICGENGEFHSFVFDAPFFQKPIEFGFGEKVLRDERFYFCDILPV